MARYMRRQTQSPGHSKLRPPVVVGAGIVYRPLQVYFVTPVSRNSAGEDRRFPYSRLRPPVVVNTAVTQIFFGPQITYWAAVKSKQNTALNRRQGISRLGKPIIPPLSEPTRITLAPQRRGRPESRLSPPTVVFTAVELSGPETHLARIRAPRTESRLQPPTVVTQPVVQIYYGPLVHLARIRPKPTISALGVFPPQAVVYAPLSTHLAYSRRGAPHSFLRGLPTGALDVYTGPRTHLTYSVRGRPKSLLRQPPFVLAPFAPITVSLARNNPRPTTTALRPPTVVQAAALLFFGPKTELAYSRRGRPLSELKPPAVVGAGRVFRGILVSLAPSPTPQRAVHSELRAPVVVRLAVEIYGPEVSLAPSRFPRPKSRLRPPAVVGREPFRGLLVQLAYSRRGVPKPFLNPPTVTARAPFAPITVHLTRIRPRPTAALIKPPTVVLQQPFRGLLIHLAYSRRGAPTSFLRLPTVIRQQPFRGLLVHLTYSRRGTPRSFLKPPTVVEPAEQFFGPQTTLVRITHPPVRWLLKPPTVTITEIPGDVDCDDSTPYEVDCSEEQSGGFAECETTAPGDTISGTDSGSGQSVAGTDRSAGSVQGGDRSS